MSKVPSLNKPKLLQIMELLEALQLCGSLVGHCKKESMYLISLSALLRALLVDKRRDSKALIPRILDDFSNLPSIYVLGDGIVSSKMKTALKEGYYYNSPWAQFERNNDNYIEISLESLLSWPALYAKGFEINFRELIEHKANRFGGAHFSIPASKVDEIILSAPNVFLTSAFSDLSSVVRGLCNRTLSEMFCGNKFFLLQLKSFPENDASIYFSIHEDSNSYLSVGVDDRGRVFVQSRGIYRNMNIVRSKKTLKLKKTHKFHVSLMLDDDFKFTLHVFVDDDSFIVCEDFQSRVILGAGLDRLLKINFDPETRRTQNFSFYFGHLVEIGGRLARSEIDVILHELEQLKKPFGCLEFLPESGGEAKIHEQALRFLGNVRHKKLKS